MAQLRLPRKYVEHLKASNFLSTLSLSVLPLLVVIDKNHDCFQFATEDSKHKMMMMKKKRKNAMLETMPLFLSFKMS